MSDTSGRGQAALVEGNTEFDARDAALLRAIHRTGSVARAATTLGRSRARALSRIESLESAFGTLVERQRGGSGGGGSQLTARATRLLDRLERLEAALEATARAPETVLRGTVTTVDGELATVETAVGHLRGIHDGMQVGEAAQIRVGADAVTIHETGTEAKPDATSARNRLSGRVHSIESGETVLTVAIDVAGVTFRALITNESARRLGLESGNDVGLTWKATATRVTPETRFEE